MNIRPYLMLPLFALTACAQDQPIVDTIQPNYTAKSDLLGREWYMRTTVVDTKFTNAQSFPGSMSNLARGVFEIQEKTLFFYRTYEFLAGSEAYEHLIASGSRERNNGARSGEFLQ